MFYTEILKQSTKNVSANFITQINHKNDPVANGWLNKDAFYIPKFNEPAKHSFKSYYPVIKNQIKNGN
ncbi:hypothetical protein [Campylobacter ureolyticus]|uniref:hypothetical protein n=1 Tax=Campylobacter ureolyticus TaxID=827 RepID=UPI0022B3F747|nr:hypothetical protein [Campylobacter ureolyticus]MCZ6104399.1 hypothetical protein [Campylobacter ureolyticus]